MTWCLADVICVYYNPLTDQPGQADDPLCAGCLTVATQAAGALLLDYRDLEQQIPPILGQWGDGQPGHSGEAQIPIRVHVEALQREIWWLTTAWAEALADRYRLSDRPTRVRDGFAVTWAVRILQPRIPMLMRLDPVQMADYPHPDEDTTTRYRTVELSHVPGWLGALDLTRLHARARAALGLNSLIKQLPGYCRDPKCGRPGLLQDNGSDTVRCGQCGATESRDDYEQRSNLFGQRRAAA